MRTEGSFCLVERRLEKEKVFGLGRSQVPLALVTLTYLKGENRVDLEK